MIGLSRSISLRVRHTEMALLQPKPLTLREIGARVLLGLALIFVIGAISGAFDLILGLVQGKGLPRWSLPTYIGATFVLGLFCLLAEMVGIQSGKC